MTRLQQFLDRLQTDFPDAYRYVWASVSKHKIEDYWVERYLGWYVGKRFLAGERESLKPLLDRICELALWIEQDILTSSRANHYRVYCCQVLAVVAEIRR